MMMVLVLYCGVKICVRVCYLGELVGGLLFKFMVGDSKVVLN